MRTAFSFLMLAFAVPAIAAEPPAYDAQRGRLLYDTQCSACHTAQAHWRDKRLVLSWSDLIREVARWENSAGQSWSEQDIGDTAAYLNGAYYRMPCAARGCEGQRADAAPEKPLQ
jgi:mono/diheme cytochrome c family protein